MRIGQAEVGQKQHDVNMEFPQAVSEQGLTKRITSERQAMT